ncbi:MAG: glycosyltransferase family 4 protein [Candidatus Hodarchaeota archaeon]
MKILHINPYPPEHLGGSELFCKNLVINLKKIKNIDSDILTSDILKRRKKADFIDRSIKIIYKKFYFNLWGKNPIVNISSYVLKNLEKYDLIHAHSYIFLTSFQCALLRRIKKFPFILHIHGGVQTPLVSSSSIAENLQLTFKNRFFDNIFGRITINSADAIISVSKKDLNILKKRYDISKKINKYIPIGIDVNKFKNEPDREKKYITFIGRLSYIKGIDRFINFVKKVYKKDKSLKFLVVGNGPLINLVIEAQKSYPITHFKFYPYDKIENIYNISKIVIIPSRFEGIPTTLLESLACETPVIANNVGGISEIIKNDVNGILFDYETTNNLDDLVLNLFDKEKQMKIYGINGRKFIQNHLSWEKVSENIGDLYKEMINNF